MTSTNETVEQRAERIVRQEVYLCLSSLVATLASGYGVIDRPGDHELSALTEQAFELAAPVPDYEEAAIEKGFALTSDGWTSVEPDARGAEYFDTAEDLCGTLGFDPYEREVYEHWAVSAWLADKLLAQGEKVDTDFAGHFVWARTTTGQGIASDSCIEAIARKLEEA